MEIAAEPLAVLVYFIFYDVDVGPSREQIRNVGCEGRWNSEAGGGGGEVDTSCGAFYWRRTRYGALTEHLRICKLCSIEMYVDRSL